MISPHLLYGTMPDALLAPLVGVCPSTIFRRRRAAGVPAYRHHRSIQRYLTLLHTHPDGLCTPALGRMLGVTRQAAHQLLRRLAREGLVLGQQARTKTTGVQPIVWHLAARHAIREGQKSTTPP